MCIDYYPFGMNQEGNWTPTTGTKNRYQYNGSTNKLGLGGSPKVASKKGAGLGMEYVEDFGLNGLEAGKYVALNWTNIHAFIRRHSSSLFFQGYGMRNFLCNDQV